jgi:hypothetical protein
MMLFDIAATGVPQDWKNSKNGKIWRIFLELRDQRNYRGSGRSVAEALVRLWVDERFRYYSAA